MRRRRELEHDDMIFLAWHAAAFQRTDKLQPLSEIMRARQPKQQQQQSWEEMRDLSVMWTHILGGQVTRKAG